MSTVAGSTWAVTARSSSVPPGAGPDAPGVGMARAPGGAAVAIAGWANGVPPPRISRRTPGENAVVVPATAVTTITKAVSTASPTQGHARRLGRGGGGGATGTHRLPSHHQRPSGEYGVQASPLGPCCRSIHSLRRTGLSHARAGHRSVDAREEPPGSGRVLAVGGAEVLVQHPLLAPDPPAVGQEQQDRDDGRGEPAVER